MKRGAPHTPANDSLRLITQAAFYFNHINEAFNLTACLTSGRCVASAGFAVDESPGLNEIVIRGGGENGRAQGTQRIHRATNKLWTRTLATGWSDSGPYILYSYFSGAFSSALTAPARSYRVPSTIPSFLPTRMGPSTLLQLLLITAGFFELADCTCVHPCARQFFQIIHLVIYLDFVLFFYLFTNKYRASLCLP